MGAISAPLSFDAIVIGAGAAGLYAALHAGRRGRRVLVIEHNAEPGAKILISGGGRCNFTNLNAADPTRYLCANPHFPRSALTRHGPEAFIALVQKHGIAFYEKTLGQLFCEGARASQKIVRMLLDECEAAGVALELNCRVSAVRRGARFIVETNRGAFESQTLCVATGGLSIPKLGASGFAFEIAKQFGVPVTPTRPGLVPLTFSEADLKWMRALSGVSAEVITRAGKAAFREAALFTHRGLSGPAILQASSYWARGQNIEIDWLPDAAEDALAQRKRERPKAQVKSVLAEMLPERLAETLLAQTIGGTPPSQEIGAIKDAVLIELMRALKSFALIPAGDEGYAKAEVMVGGIDTDALSQKSMEARAAPGLFFVGEAADVTGWLGGYNFQWAWASGWAAGQAL